MYLATYRRFPSKGYAKERKAPPTATYLSGTALHMDRADAWNILVHCNMYNEEGLEVTTVHPSTIVASWVFFPNTEQILK